MRFVPKHCTFWLLLKIMLFFISNANRSLLVKATEFYILTVYLINLLSSFISSRRLLLVDACILVDWNFLYNYAVLKKFYFFLFTLLYHLLSYLILPAFTSRTMLSRSGERDYPCLISGIREEMFSFSPLSMLFAIILNSYL